MQIRLKIMLVCVQFTLFTNSLPLCREELSVDVFLTKLGFNFVNGFLIYNVVL